MRQIPNAHYLDIMAKAITMERIMIMLGVDTLQEVIEIIEIMTVKREQSNDI